MKAADLLGLDLDLSTPDFEYNSNDYIDRNYMWYKNDEEYQNMGYDCGDSYVEGVIKQGIICGSFLVLYVHCPNYRRVEIRVKNQ